MKKIEDYFNKNVFNILGYNENKYKKIMNNIVENNVLNKNFFEGNNYLLDIQNRYLDSFERVTYTVEHHEDNIELLATSGWTVPMDFSLTQISKIKNLEKDSFFENYYTKNNNEKFKNCFENLLDDKILSQWKRLLSECIESFKNNLYIVTIPALLSIIEGLLSKKLEENDNPIKIIKVCQRQFDNSKKDSIDRLIWLSNLCFIKLLFKKSNFSGKKPDFLNRHWILHGRDSSNWNVSDSLRLFNAVNTIKESIT